MARDIPVLQTDRLVLKNISIQDTDSIVAWRSDPAVYRYFLSPHPITANEHNGWFLNSYLGNENRYDWMAYDANNNRIGVFGIKRTSRDSDTAEISYILAPDHRGKGYAGEAIRTLIDFLAVDWHCRYVIAEVHIDNVASIAFAKRFNMKLESVCNDFCLYRKVIGEQEKEAKKIYFRCDANEVIGIGHVMRCLAIAKQVRVLGCHPVFMVAEEMTQHMIREYHFDCICLNSKWDDLDSETALMAKVCQNESVRQLLVDSYYVSPGYFRVLSQGIRVSYLDDLGIHPYFVSRLINYNLYAEDLGYAGMYDEKKVELLLGPEYAPLRSEFSGTKKRAFRGIHRILISTGGTDRYNVLGHLLDYFTQSEFGMEKEFFCIVGRFHSYKSDLEQKYGGIRNIHLLTNVTNMDEYMRTCDFCITAGGSTLYELCACGTPSVLYVLADNQRDAARKFAETGLVPCIGDVREDLRKCIENLDGYLKEYTRKERWESIHLRMLSVVDGNGALRIAQSLCLT